ncbi:extracellular solute-binding protein [Clostridium sp. OF09-36]|nr:extracellular solute-binding protein [Clostridium sp. OF09-36]
MDALRKRPGGSGCRDIPFGGPQLERILSPSAGHYVQHECRDLPGTSGWVGKSAGAEVERQGSICGPGKIGYFSDCPAAAALVSPEKEQYVQELAGKLDHNLLENIAQVKEEILDGRCSVGVTTEETAQALRSSGADVDYIYPEEGTLLVLEGTAIRRGTVHEETAKQFLEFTLSKDVQKILMDSQSRRSVRQDVETPKGMDALERLPLPDADFETISMEKRKILELWKSISDAEAGMGGAS